jgi:PAS domain-containing protein
MTQVLDDTVADLRQIIADLQHKLDERTAELQENQERSALVSQAVAEGIYDWDIENNALWVSPRLIEIFGLQGLSLSAADWNARVHPDDF